MADEKKINESYLRSIQIFNNNLNIIYCIEHNSFFKYDGIIYQKIDEIELLSFLHKKFDFFDEITIRKRREILDNYRILVKKRVFEFNNENGLTFNNLFLAVNEILEFNEEGVAVKGIYDYPHSPERISTILIPYDYKPELPCPLWQSVLNEILENDLNKIKIIQEFFGYCLTRETHYEKAMVFVGEGANGKSLILNILTDMVGLENVSVLSLKHFNDSKRLGSIENKLVNIASEIPRRVEDYEADFKKIVSGEPVEVDQKYIVPYFIKPFCKLIFAANELPYIDDKSKAFYRRLLVIEFNKEFKEEEQDKNLRQKLRVELPGILNWSLEGLDRLRKRNGFLIDEYMKKTIDLIKKENNPIELWAEENIEKDLEEEVIKNDAYRSYYSWCIANGYKPVGSSKFSKEFYRIYKLDTEKDKRSGHGNRERIWPGLKLRPFWLDKKEKKNE